MRRKKLQNDLSNLQLDIVGVPMYVDVDEFVNLVTTESSKDEEEDGQIIKKLQENYNRLEKEIRRLENFLNNSLELCIGIV